MQNKIPLGAGGSSGHAGTNIPNASEEHDCKGASEVPRILFKCIPRTQGFRREASSNKFKNSEYCQKRRLHVKIVQDAYFHAPIYPSSRQYLRFAFKNKVYQFQVLPFSLNTAPQMFTRLGHTVVGYLRRLGISVIPYLDDWLVHCRPSSVTLPSVSAVKHVRAGGLYFEQKKVRAGSGVEYPVFGIQLGLDMGSISSRIQGSEDNSTCCHINECPSSQFMGSLN